MFNARSIRNKFTDLETLATVENYDIIGITETWLNLESRDYLAEYNIPGYTMFSHERENREGGGVLIYIKTNLQPTKLEKQNTNNVDKIYLQLKHDGRKIIIGLIYRPPGLNSTTDKTLFEEIAEISSTFDSIIFGDFNLPVTVWGDPITAHSGRELYTDLLESALNQHVNEPTRGDNILDIILSTNQMLVDNVNVGPDFSTSDHRIVSFTVNLDIFKSPSIEEIYLYKKGNFEKLRKILADTDWNFLSNETDIDRSWSKFSDTLNNAIKSCIPVGKRRSASSNINKPKWWNKRIEMKLSQKNRAYRKYKITKSNTDKREYEILRRETKKQIRENKRNLELFIADTAKSNPKEFYSYVRKKKVITTNIGPLRLENDEHINTDEEMANVLNDYFTSVFTCEDDLGLNALAPPLNSEKALNIFKITTGMVRNILGKINANKTPGPDKIAPRILKESMDQLSKPLATLFNHTLTSGKVPKVWKLANVTPIQKKGDKSLPQNYRPISLTSVVCKVMETILRDKMVNFLEENNLINDSQHGFRNKRSCLTNLLDFYNDVYDIYDETKAVDIIYLDFQKAFDKVPHKRLLHKLHSHGIKGNILSWLKDWLTDRKQRVVINGNASSWKNVLSGVPQGSVLGPILFIIYVNDIDEGISCKISKFADDTKITGRITTTEEKNKLQSDLNKLINWSKKWQMKFNYDKCKVLHVGNNNDQTNYSMNDTELVKVCQEKDLGVIISNDLKPSKHCTEVVKTANKLVGFIGRTFEYKSEKIILTLFNALVRPHLEYCVQFWSPYYRKDIDKLERVQRRMTKMIPRLRNRPYEERLKELKLFSLSTRRLRGDLIETFKMFRGFDNVNIHHYLNVNQASMTRNNGFKITGKHFRSHEAKYFFFNRITNVWNSLPSQVVNCNTIETFKKRLDKHLQTVPNLTYYAS